MNPRPPLLPWLLYNAVGVPAWWSGLQVARLVDAKAQRTLRGRRRLFERLALQRHRLQGCLWFHASSAGEVEQCRPLLRAARQSTLQHRPILLTAYSPSGYEHACERAEADHVEYLPLDTLWSCDRMVRWLRPAALIYVRYDAWPNLVWTARAARVPLLLSSATLSESSRRHHRLLHGFFASVYRSFDRIGCLSPEDAQAFQLLYGLDDSRVSVTGDSRFDQVLERARAAGESSAVKLLRAQPWKYLLLGSTWPADDRILVDALTEELRENPDRGLVFVAHEPTPENLVSLETRLQQAGAPSIRWSQLVELHTGRRRATAAARDPNRWRVILIDTLGQLAELYHACDVAYVGGGFSAGVHNVLEPAAAGVPVLFGPQHQRSREAERLLDRAAARCVRSAPELLRALRAWRDDEVRRQAGTRGLAYLEEGGGATARSVALLESLLSDQGSSPGAGNPST